jgi:hypothetical protein
MQDTPIEYMGLKMQWRTDIDEHHDAPWDNSDCHGSVRTIRDRSEKRPGERIIHCDRGYLVYDFQGAMKKARVEGWDTPPYNTGTKGERAVRAVEADMKFLRGYCRGDWVYVGVIVEVLDGIGEVLPNCEGSLWGIEDSDHAYIDEVVSELCDNVEREFHAEFVHGSRSTPMLLDRPKGKAAQNKRSKINQFVQPISDEIVQSQSVFADWVNVYFRIGGPISVLFKRAHADLITVEENDGESYAELKNMLAMHEAMNAPKIVYDKSVYAWAYKHGHLKFVPKKLRSTTTKKGA